MAEKLQTGHELMRGQEFLWWMRVEKENYAIKTTGGNIALLSVPGAVIGSVVSHTGRNNGVVGVVPNCLLGVVAEFDSGGMAYVVFSGVAPAPELDGIPAGTAVYATPAGKLTVDSALGVYFGIVASADPEEPAVVAINAALPGPLTADAVCGVVAGGTFMLETLAAKIVVPQSGAAPTIMPESMGVSKATFSGGVLKITPSSGMRVTGCAVHVSAEGNGYAKLVAAPAVEEISVSVRHFSTTPVTVHVLCMGKRA